MANFGITINLIIAKINNLMTNKTDQMVEFALKLIKENQKKDELIIKFKR